MRKGVVHAITDNSFHTYRFFQYPLFGCSPFFGLACSVLLVRAPVTVFFVVVNQLWQQRRHHSSVSLELGRTEWSGYHVTERVRSGPTTGVWQGVE